MSIIIEKLNSKLLEVSFSIGISTSDIDDIMCAALEGGVHYWCSMAEVVGDYLGRYAHEQISLGGTLMLHDAEENKKYKLTQKKFLNGLKLFLESGHSDLINIKDNCIDPADFDSDCADRVVQLALFGEIVFS